MMNLLFSSVFAQEQSEDLSVFSLESMNSVSRGLSAHEKLFDFFLDHPCELGIKSDCNRPLPSADIKKLKTLITELENWRVEVFANILPVSNVLNGLRAEISLGNEHKVEEKAKFNVSKLKYEKYLKITYNPLDRNSRNFIQKARIHTVINLMFFDSFFRMAEMLSKAKKIRSIIEYDMPEVGPYLNRTYSLAMSKARWEETRSAIQLLDKEIGLKNEDVEPFSEGFFHQYIAKSFIAERMRENDLSYRLSAILTMDKQINETKFNETLSKIVGGLSKIFGNTAGKFQSRDGKLKILATNTELMKKHKSELRPLDVFMEKTPFRLTDRFIPGYYGHVAIWLGSPEEVSQMSVNYKGKEIPLIHHPDMLPHLEKISQGKLIVEALREPGVTMNTFEHFLDIDDLLIIRRNYIAPKDMGEFVLKTVQQVGKLYDFNFDIETEREIVCSELAYIVFNDEEWPIEKEFGRYTISPDHVAWKAIELDYTPVMMYIDGTRVNPGRELANLRRLLNLPGGIADTPFTKNYKSL